MMNRVTGLLLTIMTQEILDLYERKKLKNSVHGSLVKNWFMLATKTTLI